MAANALFQMYFFYVNSLVERRRAITSIYLTVNGALVAAIGFITKDAPLQTWAQMLSVAALLILGIVVCGLWRRLVQQLSLATKWWYERLREMESNLEPSMNLLQREYQELYVNPIGHKSVGTTLFEISLTWLFTLAYAVFLLGVVVFGLIARQ